MSYAVTDAGEEDMLFEVKVLEELNENLDQMRSQARDCGTLCPEIENALAIAWWFTEHAYREVMGRCSNHSKGHCPCCDQYNLWRNKAEHIRRSL